MKRRSMKRRAPVSRDYIRLLVDKFDTLDYGVSIAGGLSPDEQRMRNKALVSLLYLSARRISEIVGRVYVKHDKQKIIYVDKYPGVQCSDFRFDSLEGREILIMNCRILKKWHFKQDKNETVLVKQYADVIMDKQEEPFIKHILDWLEHQKLSKVSKYMPITSTRAYQIVCDLDPRIVGSHWFRHMRLSHLAKALNPYELTEQIGFWETIDPAISYVHGEVSKYLEACDLARGDN